MELKLQCNHGKSFEGGLRLLKPPISASARDHPSASRFETRIFLGRLRRRIVSYGCLHYQDPDARHRPGRKKGTRVKRARWIPIIVRTRNLIMPRDQNRARREVALVGWMDGNESLKSKFWAVGPGELFLTVLHSVSSKQQQQQQPSKPKQTLICTASLAG